MLVMGCSRNASLQSYAVRLMKMFFPRLRTAVSAQYNLGAEKEVSKNN
jgi:hypothetical protein